jgi:transcriptional regulator GlxA family with amidase domain
MRTIGVLIFDGVGMLDVSGPSEAFARVRREGKDGCAYRIALLGVNSRRVLSDSGIPLSARQLCDQPLALDTVFVPGGTGLLRQETVEQIGTWLTAHASSLRRIVCVSNGVYPAALAGLLDGRAVATHWRYAHDLARRFPQVQVTASASFMKDGPIYSCGGATAALELTVALIAEDHGRRAGLEVARDLMTHLRPAGTAVDELAGFDYHPEPSDRLSELPAWIALHLRDNLSVDALAERACVCRRHFTRLFKQRFGKTAAEFVEQARLNEACRRLRASRASIESVAASVGYHSGDVFRRVFHRRFGVSPNHFRRHPSERAAA